VNGAIVYVRGGDLWVAPPDASAPPTPLTTTPEPESSPSLSGDGRVVFSRPGGLATMAVTGGPITPLPNTVDGDAEPAWSPDSRWIAFVRAGNILFVNPTGGLAGLIDVDDPLGSPAWSPDSCWLALTWRDGVVKVRTDGSGMTSVRTDGAEPSWGRDGRIAVSAFYGHVREVWVVAAGGGTATRVTLGGGSAPVWSPDGTLIAFQSGRSGNGDIYTVTPKGDSLTRFTSDPAPESDPTW
jgi:Tol biopolymer transport system component